MDALAENDHYFKAGNAATSGNWTNSGSWLYTNQIQITPGSAVNAFGINQANDAKCIVIDSNASTNMAVDIACKRGIQITQDIVGGWACNFSRNNVGSESTRMCDFINQSGTVGASENIRFYDSSSARTFLLDHAGAAGTAMQIDNAGTGYSLLVDHDGASGTVMELDNAGTGTSLLLDHNGASGDVLYIENTGSGRSIYIDHNDNDGSAILVDCESTDDPAVDIRGWQALQVKQDISNGFGLNVNRSIAEVGINPLVKFSNLSATNTQPTLEVEYLGGSGQGVLIKNTLEQATGDLVKIHQDHASSAAVALQIIHDGTGNEIEANFFSLNNGYIAPGGAEAMRWDVVVMDLDGTSPDSVAYTLDGTKCRGLFVSGYLVSGDDVVGTNQATPTVIIGVAHDGSNLQVGYTTLVSGDDAYIIVMTVA
jgi:hypothetical protein